MGEPQLPKSCDVAIVGGGTAGLAAAAELKRLGVGSVVVLEREEAAGGVPRHCGHYPFGLREHYRLLKGPAYARRNVELATRRGASIHCGVTVTDLRPDGELALSTAEGPASLQARRVLLCTGVRESSRAQRFIGGDRPEGVITTGGLQSLAYLQGIRPFKAPLILGSELVSFSAIKTCRHLGIRPVAMVEEDPMIAVSGLLRPYLAMHGIPLFTGVTDPRICGQGRVEALEFVNAAGEPTRLEADGIIVSGRFRPESALVAASHLHLDPGSGGPLIDQFGRTIDPSYYITGNLRRPAESSGYCWRESVETAGIIARDLINPLARGEAFVRLRPDHPAIRFVVPGRLAVGVGSPGMLRAHLGLNRPVRGRLTAQSGGRTLLEMRLNSRPPRRTLLPLKNILDADPNEDVVLSLKED